MFISKLGFFNIRKHIKEEDELRNRMDPKYFMDLD